MEEGDSCSGYTDNEIHRNQISPEPANNISAGACLSSRAGSVWFLQQYFFLMSLFLLFLPNVFIMCLRWRLLHACQLSGAGGARLVNRNSYCFFAHPSNHQKETQSIPSPLPQPCLDKEPNAKHRITDSFNPILRKTPILINEPSHPPLHPPIFHSPS